MESIYRNDQYAFYLIVEEASHPKRDPSDVPEKPSDVLPAHMQIIRETDQGREAPLVLMDYTFPVQLMPQVRVGTPGMISYDEHGREELVFSLELEVHHVNGMVQGEFTEEERYSIINPAGEPAADPDAADPADYTPDSGKNLIQCIVTDIVRKTRFAAAPRHLEHLPKQTYPPVNGRQGPYGHPSIRSLPPIQKRKRET